MEVRDFPMSEIKLDPNQPRKIVDQKSVDNLAKSMAVEGLIHPIEIDSNGMIIVGEMRYRAATKLGWETIRASMYPKEIMPYDRLRRQMSENLQQSGAKGGGQPMNAIDTAKAWTQLYKFKTGRDWGAAPPSHEEAYGIMKEISQEIGVSEDTVREYLDLLDQPGYVVEDLLKGRSRTLYSEADSVSEKYREPVKKAISEGKISNREDLRRFRAIEKSKPEKAEIEFLRITQQQNEDANQVLSRAVELNLALDKVDISKLSAQDGSMIRLQLGSTTGAIRNFVGRLNKTSLELTKNLE